MLVSLPYSRWLVFAASVVLLASLLTGCAAPSLGAPVPAAALTVFAAASLSDAFKELGAHFTAETGIPVTFNFAGSQQLSAQLEQGADADVFASASKKEMDAAVAAGLVKPGTDQVFAHNRLVVIYPRSNPGSIEHLADLARPGLKLVIADKSVPVGYYALDMLDKMSQAPQFGSDFGSRVLANAVSFEQNVKAVVSKVQLGEADAGIAYVTDVTPGAANQLGALDVPDAFNQVATYPIAPLAKSARGADAARFVAYVLSDEGQAILADYGFSGGG